MFMLFFEISTEQRKFTIKSISPTTIIRLVLYILSGVQTFVLDKSCMPVKESTFYFLTQVRNDMFTIFRHLKLTLEPKRRISAHLSPRGWI